MTETIKLELYRKDAEALLYFLRRVISSELSEEASEQIRVALFNALET